MVFFFSELVVGPGPCPAGAIAISEYCFVLVPVWLTAAEAREHCRHMGQLSDIFDFPSEAELIGCAGAAWRPGIVRLGMLCNVYKENALYLDFSAMLRC